MSFAHELRVLDLDSQIELLERLRLLSRFGSNLINLSGPEGCGKTWIAQRFLEAYSQDKNQALLMCHPNQSDEQRRAILLNQVVANPLFNESDPVIESFARMVGDAACDLVLVVDDAHLLSGTLLAELWTLVLEAQAIPSWNINIVLFSNRNSLDPVLSRLSYGQELKPISLEIEALREDEAAKFLELLVLKYVHGEDEKKRVRKQARMVPELPGAIMALGERKVERKIIIRSIIGSPLKIAVLVLALLLLVAGGYIWFLTQPMPAKPDTMAEESQQAETETETVTETAEKMVLTADGQSNMPDMGAEDTPAVGPDGAENDSEDVSIETVGEAPSVGEDGYGQRVVVPSTVVDALLEGKTPSETVIIDEAVEDAKEQAQESAQPVETTQVPQQEQPPLITFSFAKDELMAVSDRNYTIQLAALTSLEDVQDFLAEHGMENRVRIYPTVRGEQDWYIVTYKDYPTIQQARDGRSELPASVQTLDPWAKSMLQVHREIERGN
ncbi:AAA family ATPase [Vibrio sp. JC009]|uniref:AAA family ATPase n=1 Tax=Vibrio sp. JC009 TaxID=2912314 RepID=UPI0023AF2960|nr:AAA family ATPase [Vibrio sp. JC009]WED21628.1 AAA family ATPase [Vibrio sp. JC009]